MTTETRWLLSLLAYTLLLLLATHTPTDAPMEAGGVPYDKPAHLVAYFLLGLLALCWRRAAGDSGWPARGRVMAAIAVVAALDELTQPLVGRVCDINDWVADLVGAALAALIDWWWNRPAMESTTTVETRDRTPV